MDYSRKKYFGRITCVAEEEKMFIKTERKNEMFVLIYCSKNIIHADI